MSVLDDVATIEITTGTKTPTRAGFGYPLVAGYTTVFPERVRQYASLAAMVADGFLTTDLVYLAAAACFAQDPSPTRVYVGRCANTQKQKIRITPHASPLASTVYKTYLNGQARYYTTDDTPTVAEITAGLTAALEPAAWQASTSYAVGGYVTNDSGPVKVYICTTAGTSAGSGGPTGTGTGIVDNTCTWDYVGADQNVTATDGTSYVDVESDAIADQFRLYAEFFNYLGLNDITPNGSPSGIAEDLAAIQIENDDWYGLVTTNQGKAVIQAASAWAEAQTKIYFPTSPDVDIIESGSSDLASALNAASYGRTALMWHPRQDQYAGAAWAGYGLPQDPGSITWKYKTLAGVTYSELSETQIGYLRAKKCNFYNRLAGISITQDGKVSDNEWIDVVRGIDWTKVRMQENIFSVLANAKKIPYTDKGASVIQGTVKAVLMEGVGNDLYAADPEPTVTVPKVADVPAADKANRLLPDVEFTATLAGAIHTVAVSGVVSV